MAASRSDFQGSFRGFLTLYIFQVRPVIRFRCRPRLRWRQYRLSLEMIEQCQQVGRCQYLYIARPGGLRSLQGGTDQTEIFGRCMERGQ